jgi:hypothetical protein
MAKRTLFKFEMIADSRDHINIDQRIDELDAAVCRLKEVNILSHARKNPSFPNGVRQVRYTYTAQRNGTWKEAFAAINHIKPVYFTII